MQGVEPDYVLSLEKEVARLRAKVLTTEKPAQLRYKHCLRIFHSEDTFYGAQKTVQLSCDCPLLAALVGNTLSSLRREEGHNYAINYSSGVNVMRHSCSCGLMLQVNVQEIVRGKEVSRESFTTITYNLADRAKSSRDEHQHAKSKPGEPQPAA